MNDDGYSDVVISAYGADEAYVFYGAPIFTSTTYALGSFADNDGFVISAGNNGDVLIVSGAGVRARKLPTSTTSSSYVCNNICTVILLFGFSFKRVFI